MTGQDRYKLPLADADAYYFPDFVDPRTAQRWHDELLNLEECEPSASGTVQEGPDSRLRTLVSPRRRPLSLCFLSRCPECTKQGINRLSRSTANP